jgi:UDPglucose--hexose-1-phosphate uridylyltransferase
MRVVPNKYPAVTPLKVQEKQYQHRHMRFLIHDGILNNNQVPAVGFHEVVIESPYHNDHIAIHHDNHIMARDLLRAFRDRGLEHREYEEIEHTVFFKNHGSTAGASLVHPHSQIVSTPVVPVEAERLQSLALGYFMTHRSNLYERIVEEELQLLNQNPQGDGNNRNQSRLVDLTENFVALVPFASPGPYVVIILPRFQASGTIGSLLDSSDFTTLSDGLLDECAVILQSCLRRLHILLEEPDFNLVVQTAPVPQRGVQAAVHSSAFFRWHIRITPRLGAGAMAGFELGSGFFSNSHMPEHDASELRDVIPLLQN